MSSPASGGSGWALRAFDESYAATLATWVEGEQELLWLAPGSDPPLTAAKVAGWKREHGRPLLLFLDDHPSPIGYGELNPMPSTPGSLWLGHVMIHPENRGQGFGRILTAALLRYAFEEMHAKRVSLIVFPGNVAAIRCYTRAGFKTVGDEFHRFGRSGRRFRLLRLQIDAPA